MIRPCSTRWRGCCARSSRVGTVSVIPDPGSWNHGRCGRTIAGYPQGADRCRAGGGLAAGGRARSSVPHPGAARSEEHTSELQSRENLVCRLLLEKKNLRTASEYLKST